MMFSLVYILVDDRIHNERKFHICIYCIITLPSFLLSITQLSFYLKKKMEIPSRGNHSISEFKRDFKDNSMLRHLVPKEYLSIPFFLACFLAMSLSIIAKRQSTTLMRLMVYSVAFIISIIAPLATYLAYYEFDDLIQTTFFDASYIDATSIAGFCKQRGINHSRFTNLSVISKPIIASSLKLSAWYLDQELYAKFLSCVESKATVSFVGRFLWACYRRDFFILSILPGVLIFLTVASSRINHVLITSANRYPSQKMTRQIRTFSRKTAPWVVLAVSISMIFHIAIFAVIKPDFLWANSASWVLTRPMNFSNYKCTTKPFEVSLDAFGTAMSTCSPLNEDTKRQFYEEFSVDQHIRFFHLLKFEDDFLSLNYRLYAWNFLPLLVILFSYCCLRVGTEKPQKDCYNN